jgi:hypothetical protein
MAVGFTEKPLERPPVEYIVWRVRKDTRTAEARIRDVPGYGVELRFLIRDALVESRMFRLEARSSTLLRPLDPRTASPRKRWSAACR